MSRTAWCAGYPRAERNMCADSPTWRRPDHEDQGGTAVVAFVAFAERDLDLANPPGRKQFGVPPEFDLDALDIRHHPRASAPEWFNGFFTPEMLAFSPALADLGDRLEDLRTAYSVRIFVPEPDTLSYLQGCWGAAMWLCQNGATILLDEHAIRWHHGEDVAGLDPARAFDVKREITVVFETDAEPDFGHVMHTRGLAKFGRPDFLLRGVEREDVHAGGVLLNGLAHRAAQGAAFREGQTVSPNQLSPRKLLKYEPGAIHPEVNLNNDGLLLDITGWGLRDLG